MADYKIKVQKRETLGRKVKKLREEGVLPANVYGRKIESQSIKLDKNDFVDVFKKAGETSIIELTLGKKKLPTLVSNVQLDPLSDEPLHVDFMHVDLTQKVSADVPVELVGESPAEKSGVGVVVQQFYELEVEALPTDIPERFEVDVSSLEEVDDSILIKDLKFDKDKVELKTEMDQIVAKVEPPREEEEEPVVAEVGMEETEEEEEEAAEQGEDQPEKESKEEQPKQE